MMTDSLKGQLDAFRQENKIRGKGPLSVMLHVTRLVLENGLPANADDWIAKSGGQVAGLGKSSVQKILSDYDINRTLASEGGRTSRGSIGNMRNYVFFLSGLEQLSKTRMQEIEQYWIQCVHDFFASKPFRLRYDSSVALRVFIIDLLAQAKERDKDGTGTRFVGVVLQHLVGAKLRIALPEQEIRVHGASVADHSTDREGDFVIGETAIHVTSFPQESLLEKCRGNIENDLHPIIVTLRERIDMAEAQADHLSILNRVEVYDAVQFITLNIREWSDFSRERKKPTVAQLVAEYNSIIEACETDPSLKIKM